MRYTIVSSSLYGQCLVASADAISSSRADPSMSKTHLCEPLVVFPPTHHRWWSIIHQLLFSLVFFLPPQAVCVYLKQVWNTKFIGRTSQNKSIPLRQNELIDCELWLILHHWLWFPEVEFIHKPYVKFLFWTIRRVNTPTSFYFYQPYVLLPPIQ